MLTSSAALSWAVRRAPRPAQTALSPDARPDAAAERFMSRLTMILNALAQGRTHRSIADDFAHLNICPWQYPVERCTGVDAPTDGFHEVCHRLGHGVAIQPCTHCDTANIAASSKQGMHSRRPRDELLIASALLGTALHVKGVTIPGRRASSELCTCARDLTDDHPAEGLRLLTERRLRAERPAGVQHVRTEPCGHSSY